MSPGIQNFQVNIRIFPSIGKVGVGGWEIGKKEGWGIGDLVFSFKLTIFY